MTCIASSSFPYKLLFLVLFVARQAKPGNNVNSTPVSSKGTKQCNKVYNNFYHTPGPNKKIEALLQDMKIQLTHIDDDIHILKRKQDDWKRLDEMCENCVEHFVFTSSFWVAHSVWFRDLLYYSANWLPQRGRKATLVCSIYNTNCWYY